MLIYECIDLQIILLSKIAFIATLDLLDLSQPAVNVMVLHATLNAKGTLKNNPNAFLSSIYASLISYPLFGNQEKKHFLLRV